MSLDLIFQIILLILIGFEFAFITIPLGADGVKSKRAPLITFGIVAINVLIYYGSFSATTRQEIEIEDARQKILRFLEDNHYVLLFKDAQERVRETDLVDNDKILTPRYKIVLPEPDDESVKKKLGKFEAEMLHDRFISLLNAYNETIKGNIYYQYGLAPDGRWTFRQLWTYMFLHGSMLHLLGNMVFLLALGCSLEVCWGHGSYAAFYLLVGATACIPSLMNPANAPMIGASGAISGVMGAFIVALRRKKIKVGWLSIPFAVFFLMFRRKPFGIVRIPAYIFLTFYFVSQLTFWWVSSKAGASTGIAYSAHVGGFFFGVFLGVFHEAYRSFKYPEAVVEQMSVEKKAPPPPVAQPSLSPAVSQSLDLLRRGRVEEAERKLKYQLFRNPGDAEAIKTLIEIYQRSSNHEQMNEMSARLIRHCLSDGDKASALWAYDNLLRSLPADQITPRIPARDWMVLCDFMRRQGMNSKAAAECERLVKAWPDDPLASRACVTGGEAALSINDKTTAMRLFETALKMNPVPAIEERARRGIAVCSYLSDSSHDGSLLQHQA